MDEAAGRRHEAGASPPRGEWGAPLLLLAIYLASRAFMIRDLPRPFCDEGFWTWAVVLWQRTGHWMLLPELPHLVLSPVNSLLWILWSQLVPLNILTGRFLVVLLGAGTLLLTYAAARRSWGRRIALLTTLPFVFGSYYFGFARSIHLEPIVIFWCALAWFFWVRPGRACASLAGLAAGFALATKVSGGIVLIAILADAFRRRQGTISGGTPRTRGIMVLAAASICAVCLYGAFAIWTGPFFWNAWRDYRAINTQGTNWGILLQSGTSFVARQPLLIVGSLIGLLCARRSGRDVFFPLAWLIAGILLTVATRALGHWRLFVFFPPLCVFFAFGLEAAAARARRVLPSVSRPLAVIAGVWIVAEMGAFVGYHHFVVKDRDALFRLAEETERSVPRDQSVVSHPLLSLVVDRQVVPFFGFERSIRERGSESPAEEGKIGAIVFFDAIGGITPWKWNWMEDPLTGAWTREHFESVTVSDRGDIWVRKDPARERRPAR